jgi:hypothetical protein
MIGVATASATATAISAEAATATTISAAIATEAATRTESATISTAIAATWAAKAATLRTITCGTIFPGTGNIYFKRTAHEFLAFCAVCCILCFFRRCHSDEGETSGAIGETITHNLNLLYCAILAEILLQVFFRGTPSEVTNE